MGSWIVNVLLLTFCLHQISINSCLRPFFHSGFYCHNHSYAVFRFCTFGEKLYEQFHLLAVCSFCSLFATLLPSEKKHALTTSKNCVQYQYIFITNAMARTNTAYDKNLFQVCWREKVPNCCRQSSHSSLRQAQLFRLPRNSV